MNATLNLTGYGDFAKLAQHIQDTADRVFGRKVELDQDERIAVVEANGVSDIARMLKAAAEFEAMDFGYEVVVRG